VFSKWLRFKKSSVTLRIGGDDLVPHEITKLLGAQPTTAQAKGDKIVGRKTGQVRIAKMGIWMLEAMDREPEDIDGQVQEVLGQVTGDLTIWKSFGQKYQIDLFCGIFLDGSNEGMTLSAACLAILGKRGIEMGLDIYSGHVEDEPDT
jgi:ribosomal protein L19